MANESKDIPTFMNEDEERAFWTDHDSIEYLDWDRSNLAIFPNLKPTTKVISIRLPAGMLHELRVLANKRDVPYQSLIKIFLKERLDQELHMYPEGKLSPVVE